MRLKKEFNEELMRQAILSEEQKMQELFVKKNNQIALIKKNLAK